MFGSQGLERFAQGVHRFPGFHDDRRHRWPAEAGGTGQTTSNEEVMSKRDPPQRVWPRSLHPIRRAIFVLAMLLAALLSLARNGLAQETAEYFRTRCTSCHTIGGGRLTGPDLKNVMQQAAATARTASG